MADFQIEIAGCTVQIRSLFESTRDYCRRYFSENTPTLFLTVTHPELEQEQQLLLEEARQEGIRPRRFPDPFLERSILQRKLAQALIDRDILLLHGSTVAVDGRAYLFTAPCGTGKSTHTRLWREVFGSRAIMVNDDKPFLRFTQEGVLACGAPWSGKHGLDTNITVPLAGICLLARGTENRIMPADRESLLPLLLHQACPPQEDRQHGHFQALVARLCSTVPLWQMECTKNPQAACVAFAAMSGEKQP